MAAKKLHQGPILPLALMAMLALAIPVFFVANSKSNLENSNAAGFRFTKPTNEPTYLLDDSQATPVPTSKSMMMRGNGY